MHARAFPLLYTSKHLSANFHDKISIRSSYNFTNHHFEIATPVTCVRSIGLAVFFYLFLRDTLIRLFTKHPRAKWFLFACTAREKEITWRRCLVLVLSHWCSTQDITSAEQSNTRLSVQGRKNSLQLLGHLQIRQMADRKSSIRKGSRTTNRMSWLRHPVTEAAI